MWDRIADETICGVNIVLSRVLHFVFFLFLTFCHDAVFPDNV